MKDSGCLTLNMTEIYNLGRQSDSSSFFGLFGTKLKSAKTKQRITIHTFPFTLTENELKTNITFKATIFMYL